MDVSLLMDVGQRNPSTLLDFFNAMPCFAGSGGKISSISKDLKTVEICVPLNDSTRNVVGTIYGGSMYGASDAVYMMLLWFQLGNKYLLVDRASRVEYLRPGLSDVVARCTLTGDVVQSIELELSEKISCLREFLIEFRDAKDRIVCKIEKTVYIRKAP